MNCLLLTTALFLPLTRTSFSSSCILLRALHREVPLTSTCDVLGVLLNGEYFYVTALLCFLVVVSILLAMLIFEQFVNIARNMVRLGLAPSIANWVFSLS